MLRTILDFVLPPRCRICDASTMDMPNPWVCEDCWLQVDYITSSICYQCGQPLAAPPEGIASAQHRCGNCLLHPPPFDRARAVGLYRGVLMHVIHAMKYQRIYALIHPLADLLQSQFNYHWGDAMPDVLVPVPLHWRRLHQREFDQASALALELSRRLGIPLDVDMLRRHHYTQSQVGLSAEARRRNVRDAFRLGDAPRCRDKRILLIDDVLTTGATAWECAHLLARADAARVDVYTLARVE